MWRLHVGPMAHEPGLYTFSIVLIYIVNKINPLIHRFHVVTSHIILIDECSTSPHAGQAPCQGFYLPRFLPCYRRLLACLLPMVLVGTLIRPCLHWKGLNLDPFTVGISPVFCLFMLSHLPIGSLDLWVDFRCHIHCLWCRMRTPASWSSRT